MGWITPLGHDLETVWSNLLHGRSGVGPIERFDAATFPTSFAAEVRDYDFAQYVADPKMHEHAGVHTQFALGGDGAGVGAGVLESVAGSRSAPHRHLPRRRRGRPRLRRLRPDRHRLVGRDEAACVDLLRWRRAALEYLELLAARSSRSRTCPSATSPREFGIRGPAYNCLTACAASTQAVGEACEHHPARRRRRHDLRRHPHDAARARRDRLQPAHRAVDPQRRSARRVPSVRSHPQRLRHGRGRGDRRSSRSLEHAERRGATPLAEIAGYGSSADAFRITDMHPEGRGPGRRDPTRRSTRRASIRTAWTSDGRPLVHYISAHGTGTQENDSIETQGDQERLRQQRAATFRSARSSR